MPSRVAKFIPGSVGNAFPCAGARACLRLPLRAGTPRSAPDWRSIKRNGADDALCPAAPSALLLRARPFLRWAPRALRLRLAWAKARPARRQGPAGASDPGHEAMPACGRGARCLLVQFAGRSPFMKRQEDRRTARLAARCRGAISSAISRCHCKSMICRDRTSPCSATSMPCRLRRRPRTSSAVCGSQPQHLSCSPISGTAARRSSAVRVVSRTAGIASSW